MGAGPRARKLPLGILFLTVFLDLVGFGMILPLLPFYAQDFGADALAIGVLFASYSLAQAICSPLLGRLSDRLGRRPVLLAAILGNALSHFAFAAGGSLLVLLLARTAAGAAAANYSIAQAYIADVTAPEDRSRGMGLIGAALGLGFVLGPALGGLVVVWGHRAVPAVAGLLSLLNFFLALTLLPESRATTSRRAGGRSWQLFAAGFSLDRALVGLLALLFLVITAFSIMEATLALYCEEHFGFGVRETSWLFVFLGVVIAAVQAGLVGRMVRRFGEIRLVAGGILLMGLGLAVIPLSPSTTLLAVATALLAVGSGLHQPALLGLLSRLTSADRQGGTLGLSRSMSALARSVGPVWGGWVFKAFGSSSPFWTSASLMGVAFLAALLITSRLPAWSAGQAL